MVATMGSEEAWPGAPFHFGVGAPGPFDFERKDPLLLGGKPRAVTRAALRASSPPLLGGCTAVAGSLRTEAPSNIRMQQRSSGSSGSSGSRSSMKALMGELVRQRARRLASSAASQRRAADAAWRCLLQPSVHCSSNPGSSCSSCSSTSSNSSNDAAQQEGLKLRLLQQQQQLLLQRRARDSEFLSLAASVICGGEDPHKAAPPPPLSHLQKPLLLLLLLANAVGGGHTGEPSAANGMKPHRELLRLEILKLLQQHQQHGLQQQQQQSQLQAQQLVRPHGERLRPMNEEGASLSAASSWASHQSPERGPFRPSAEAGPFGGFTGGPLKGLGADLLCQATTASSPDEGFFGAAQLQPMQRPSVSSRETHGNPARPAAAPHSAAAVCESSSSSSNSSSSSSWLRGGAISDLIGGAHETPANVVEEAPSGSPNAGSSIFASMGKAFCSIEEAATTAEQQRFADQHELLRQPSLGTPRGAFPSAAPALETISDAAPAATAAAAAAAAAAGLGNEAEGLKHFLVLALREDSSVTLKGRGVMKEPQHRQEAWAPPQQGPPLEGKRHLPELAFFSHLPEEALLSFNPAPSNASPIRQGGGMGAREPPGAPFQEAASVAADAWIAATRRYMSPEATLALLPHIGPAAAAATANSLAEAVLGGTLAGLSQRGPPAALACRLQEARRVVGAKGGPRRRGGPSVVPLPPMEGEEQQGPPDGQETQLLQVSWPLNMSLKGGCLSGHEVKPPQGATVLPRWAQCCCLVLLGAPSPLFPLVPVCCCSSTNTNPDQQQEQQMPFPDTHVQPQKVLLAPACSSTNSSSLSSSSEECCPGKARPFFAAADFRCCYAALLPPNSAAAAATAAAAAEFEAAGPWRAVLEEMAE
ncbi:hypothetical protein ACSSS7_001011 [Eimeria intestinalis]